MIKKNACSREEKKIRGIAIAVYSSTKDKDVAWEHLEELKELASTCGILIEETSLSVLKKINVATFLGKGKLEEIKTSVIEQGLDTVIFDDEITPSQQRNLEKYFNVDVFSRTELVLDIFSQRAQTKEAELQVELAKAKYMFPRLKRLWGHFSRQRAKGGFLKGEGEKQLELDRRILKNTINKLSLRLSEIEKQRNEQKKSRNKTDIKTFAIIGYTNAGKSTLFNLLTEAEVLADNKLFATLDPKTKKIILPNKKEVIITDTVGFIRKLPHTLISAFKSTLESTLQGHALIHVIDVSNPCVEDHIRVTYDLLQELKIENPFLITVLNKIDLVKDEEKLLSIVDSYPKAILFSAKQGKGKEELLSLIEEFVSLRDKKVFLTIPSSNYKDFSTLLNKGYVLSHFYEDNNIVVEAELPNNILNKYLKYLFK